MKKYLFVLLAVLVVGVAQGQGTYKKAVGLNLGWPMGINYKQFISDQSAIEATLGYVRGGVMLTALYEYHINLVENFNMYVGGGLNVGAVGLNYGGHFALGIDPVVGFEYKFSGAPIALAIDYAPQINIFSAMNFSTAAFKVRFAF